MKNRLLFITMLSILGLSACSTAPSETTLRSAYSDYFPVGVALSGRTLGKPSADSLVAKQFSSVTAENWMKGTHIGVAEGEYNFADGDRICDFAEANGMVVRGHTLLWQTTTPDWFFAPDKDGNEATKEVVLARLERYIKDVVGHYKGRVYCWDVANEVLSDTEGEYMREYTKWYKLFGSTEFVEKAFIYAHEADPDALLFYNDYSVVYPSKQPQMLRLVEELLAKGVPIHGIGMQAHWDIFNPTQQQVESAIEKFAALGMQIHITELDLKVNPQRGGGELEAKDQDYAVFEMTPELIERQSAQYKMLFDTFRKYSDVVTNVTFWNVHDGATWLNERKNNVGLAFPLLFDDNLQPKPCYYSVVEFEK